VPALGSGKCLLMVGAVEECGLFASRLLVGTRCPACKLWLAPPNVKLDCTRGVSMPGQLEVVQDLEGLEASRGPFSLFFCCLRGHSHCTCGASITRVHPKDPEQKVVDGGVLGAIFFELDLACSQRLLGKN
jgi:hypothetical protein